MSTIIKIKCIDQTLTYEGTPVVASGGVNEDYVEFTFCSLWYGFSKVVVFYQNKGEIYYSLVSADNKAVVPKEVTATKGTMYLGVMGVNGDVTRTSQVLQYRIESGALDGFTPEEPTADIYQQILAELQTIRDLSAETLSNEEAFEKAITEKQNNYETNLNGQMATFRTEVDAEIVKKLSKVYRPCGSVANFESLPTDAEVGDVYNLLDTGVNWAWTGTEWDSLAGIIDISNFYTRTEADTLLDKKINVADTDVIARHRIPRGKDITEYYQDGTLWTRIANNFDDIYVGDYFKMSRPISAYEQTQTSQATGSQYVTISELNPEYYNGESGNLAYNHIELIPGQFKSGEFHFGRSRMNSTNTTVDGYMGSEMYTTTLGTVTTSGSTASTASINQQLYAEFGTHLKTFKALLSNGINSAGYDRFGTNDGCANSWSWADVQSVLLSEMDVYGGTIWSSSGYDSGASKTQKSLFKFCPECINNRSAAYWLKDVVTSNRFARVDAEGRAYYASAGYTNYYVRPRFIVS